MVEDGVDNRGIEPWGKAALGNTLFFIGKNTATNTLSLYKTSGRASGIDLVKEGTGSMLLGTINGWIYFKVNEGSGKLWLARTDGTQANTTVFSLPTGGYMTYDELVEFAGRMFFPAYDPAHGAELWTTDGSPAGTHLAHDLIPGENASVPANLAVVNNILFFSTDFASMDVYGQGLWAMRSIELNNQTFLPAIHR